METSNGIPGTFSLVSLEIKIVRLSTDLNLRFSAMTICMQSMVWRLEDVDVDTGQRYVITDGVKGNSSLETMCNWFKIDRYGRREYKLVLHSRGCGFCKVVCGDVGVFGEGGKRWLGLSDVTFPVMFKKGSY
ncbi:putative Miraculin [Cocos nucifera]|uniref:Putative Miraculin n=1 Tax=Cocos nucifera TaxID=13894 RepID=A0A8K0IFM9_COCNU|nr:putative Miraculin [Cocos nucifera]